MIGLVYFLLGVILGGVITAILIGEAEVYQDVMEDELHCVPSDDAAEELHCVPSDGESDDVQDT